MRVTTGVTLLDLHAVRIMSINGYTASQDISAFHTKVREFTAITKLPE